MEKLSGPASYDHFNFRGKDYLFFGDVHVKKNPCSTTCSQDQGCQDFINFLKKFSQQMVNDKIYMDVFLESPYGYDFSREQIPRKISDSITIEPPEFNLSDSYLADVLNDTDIKNCLTYAKRGCIYNPYVRIHYADLRFFSKEDRLLSTPFSSLIKHHYRSSEYARLFFDYGFLREYFNLMFYSNNFSKDGIDLLLKYPSLVTTNVIDHFEIIDLQMHPIRKQIMKVEHLLSELVYKFIMSELDIKMNEAIQVLQKVHWQLSEPEKEFIDAIFGFIDSFIMDAYLLLRLFRTFDKPSNMAIIYTGGQHSDNYSKFFRKYLGAMSFPSKYASTDVAKKFYKNLEIPNQCITDDQLNSLINSPRLSTQNLDIGGGKINKQYLYGLVMTGTPVQLVYNGQKYTLNKSNVHQILQVGFDTENYYLKNGDYDRIYFSDSIFLEGYTKYNKLYVPIFMKGTNPIEVEWTEDNSLTVKGNPSLN